MKRLSLGAKICALSVAGAILGYNLCGGLGVVVGNSQTPLEKFASVVFVVSCVGVLVGIVIWFVEGISGD